MLELQQTKTFKKCLKKYKYNKTVITELKKVTELLINEKQLPNKYHDHELKRNYKGVRELHLKPNDLLLYVKIEKEKIMLMTLGNHANNCIISCVS